MGVVDRVRTGGREARVSRVTKTFRGAIFVFVVDYSLVCGARCARDAVTAAEGRTRRVACIALDSTSSSPFHFVSTAKKKVQCRVLFSGSSLISSPVFICHAKQVRTTTDNISTYFIADAISINVSLTY